MQRARADVTPYIDFNIRMMYNRSTQGGTTVLRRSTSTDWITMIEAVIYLLLAGMLYALAWIVNIYVLSTDYAEEMKLDWIETPLLRATVRCWLLVIAPVTAVIFTLYELSDYAWERISYSKWDAIKQHVSG